MSNHQNKVKFFEFLYKVKPAMVAEFIEYEHPQTLAVIISNLDNKYAAQVLACLADELQAEIISRIAVLVPIPIKIINRISVVLESRLPALTENLHIPEEDKIALILKEMSKVDRGTILEKIEYTNEDLVSDIKSKL